MIFTTRSRSYQGSTAVDVIHAIERDELGYPHQGAGVRQFLQWSLQRLEALIPLRELFLDVQVGDETLALSYLLLLEQYGLGDLHDGRESRKAGRRSEM